MNIRSSILIMVIFTIIVSCKESKKKSFIDKVHPDDIDCFNEIERAEKDIENKKLVYCHSTGSITYSLLRCKKEMDSLLQQNNIVFEYTSSSDVVYENKTQGCYCSLMLESIAEKFGAKFIDSIFFQADSLYILKNLDKVFEYSDYDNGWDNPPLYPNDTSYDATNHSGLQKAFESVVKYPNNYVFRNDKRPSANASVSINLIVDKDGKARVLDSSFDFWNSQTKKEDYRNEKHYAYLRKLATELIENVKWAPAKVKNINVKSKSNIYIYF
jgi:hypothetical protein